MQHNMNHMPPEIAIATHASENRYATHTTHASDDRYVKFTPSTPILERKSLAKIAVQIKPTSLDRSRANIAVQLS